MTDHLPSKPEKKRRYHSPDFKAKVVALCQVTGATRAAVARRFELNDNLVHKWCVEAKQNKLPAVAPGFVELPAATSSAQPKDQTVQLEYRTAKGQLTIHWPLAAIEQSIPWLKALEL